MYNIFYLTKYINSSILIIKLAIMPAEKGGEKMEMVTTADIYREIAEDRHREAIEGDWSLQYASYIPDDEGIMECMQSEEDYEENKANDYFNLKGGGK